jgi:hypothetical protein
VQDDLGRAQERLGRTLARARASEDRELAARVRDEGFQLVHLLNGVMHMSRLHSSDNRAFDQPVRDLERTFRRLMELLGPLHLVCVEDQIYLNEVRIRGDERGEATRALGAELLRHGVGGLRFFEEPSEAQIRRLVACFARRPADEQPRAALRQAFEENGLSGIEAAGLFRFRTSDERPAESVRDLGDIAARATATVAEAWENLGRKRLPNPLPLRRAITEILSAGPGAEAFWNLPDGDQPHAAHSLRVACLALVLGQQIGLSDATLQDLGVAALLHDVGYAAGAGGPLTPFARHPEAGARLLLRQRGFHESKLRRARAVLQHHRSASDPRRPALFARLLRIADDYDTLVRAGGAGLSPHEALGRLAAGSGSTYDAVLVQAFVNALGRFPPGTRLTLEDGRRVRVVAPGQGAAGFARPVVMVEPPAGARSAAPPERLDLARVGLRVREDVVRAAPPARAAVPAAAVAPPARVAVPAAVAPPTVAPPAVTAFEGITWPASDGDALVLENSDDLVLVEAHAARPAPAPATRPAPAAADTPDEAPDGDDAGLAELLRGNDDAAPAGDESLAASGEITPATLPALLGDVRARRRSGLLLLQAGHEERRLLFVDGELAQATSNRSEHQLEAVLLSLGLVAPLDLERASRAAAAAGRSLARELVERGLVTAVQLQAARVAQVRAIFTDLARWDEGDYLFGPQERARDEDAAPGGLPTAELILDLVRCIEDPDVVRFALGDFGQALVLAPEAYQPGGPRLGAVDRAVLAAVGGGATAGEALARTPGDPEQARASLLSLLATALVRRA